MNVRRTRKYHSIHFLSLVVVGLLAAGLLGRPVCASGRTDLGQPGLVPAARPAKLAEDQKTIIRNSLLSVIERASLELTSPLDMETAGATIEALPPDPFQEQLLEIIAILQGDSASEEKAEDILDTLNYDCDELLVYAIAATILDQILPIPSIVEDILWAVTVLCYLGLI